MQRLEGFFGLVWFLFVVVLVFMGFFFLVWFGVCLFVLFCFALLFGVVLFKIPPTAPFAPYLTKKKIT